jgi:hypothetical protein
VYHNLSMGATAMLASNEPMAVVGEIQRQDAVIARKHEDKMGLERRSTYATKAMAEARDGDSGAELRAVRAQRSVQLLL